MFIFYLTLIFLVIFLLSYILRKSFTYFINTLIKLYSKSIFFSYLPLYFQYILIPINVTFLIVSKLILFIAYIYFVVKLIKLNIYATFASVIVFVILIDSFFSNFF